MPLARWNHYRRTRHQKRTALQLLALSGVVRPSTIEPRYTLSPLKVAAIRERPEHPLIAQNLLGTVQSPASSFPGQTPPPLTPPAVTAKAWCEQSLQHLRQLLQWDVGKAAGRAMSFPSAR